MGQGNRENRAGGGKDFNVEFLRDRQKPFQKAVQPIYDGLKVKPRLYGLYQRIQTKQKYPNQEIKMNTFRKRTSDLLLALSVAWCWR